MRLKLIENQSAEDITVTIEYREKKDRIDKLIDYVEHLDEMEHCFAASAGGRIYSIRAKDILYVESVDRKTFGYTAGEVYELGCKLYEIEERYKQFDYFRISKSCIVNLKKIHSLKPEFGGKILVTMENKEKLYISRQYAPLLREKIGLGGKR